MTPTQQYIEILTRLKDGELTLFRKHAGDRLDERVTGFDLFTGIWWPLRQKNAGAPRREVAWLIAKLYAASKIQPSNNDNETLACQLRKCCPKSEPDKTRFRQRVDQMLVLSIDKIEHFLRWALTTIALNGYSLDWVKLTDDLSIWERESTRYKWAEQFLNNNEG
ncbi:MAG: type I-E CRISPR-associated protein Cse2/CasB [Candidatus Magnetoovum sp. WYHC-5]|nr:type I-E CRISPR-associated protein Cse2/CasB [Candidatus Magnetoovum sp. WYHC-5]